MKTVIKKLCTSCGETLVETLSAFLIISLTGVMLLTAIATSYRINYKVELIERDLRYQLEYAERRAGTAEGNVSITFGSQSFQQPVYFTGSSEQGQLVSYKVR